MNVTDTASAPQPSARVALVARRGARVLEVLAALLGAITVIGNWILVTTNTNAFFGGPGNTNPGIPGKYKFGQFVQAAVPTLAWLTLVLAAAFGLEIVALRAERATVPAADPFAPDTSPAISPNPPTGVARGGPTVPLVAPRREAPITVEVDESLWRR